MIESDVRNQSAKLVSTDPGSPVQGFGSSGVFRYTGYEIDEVAGTLMCHYSLELTTGEVPGDLDVLMVLDKSLVGASSAGSVTIDFCERFYVPTGRFWTDHAYQAARILYLLAGVSYYKAGAPPEVDLGDTAIDIGEAEFLRSYLVNGLGEFAYQNRLDLSSLAVNGGQLCAEGRSGGGAKCGPKFVENAPWRLNDLSVHGVTKTANQVKVLVPFGGGMDSIVTVELLRSSVEDISLFVLSVRNNRFDAIETSAAVTQLPILRAERELDEKILRSKELGFINGHVPVTGIVSAAAVLMAALEGCDFVVMSNERSASDPSTLEGGIRVNHQWSKGVEFEESFAAVVHKALQDTLGYFSLLRPASELWIASTLASLTKYLPVFRSCNRSFHLDPAQRFEHWCGICDKCCFVDLILAPFVDQASLAAVFGGKEPLDQEGLFETFATLLDIAGKPKPFECVGDSEECRAAAFLASQRPDRALSQMLHRLVGQLASSETAVEQTVGDLLSPRGPHLIPDAFQDAVFTANNVR